MIDPGHGEVQLKFLGRGNAGGDAVVYLPNEKIVITGDLGVRQRDAGVAPQWRF